MSFEKIRTRLVGPDMETWIDKTITAAQTVLLNTTAVEIVAAPQAGHHLVFLGAELRKPANTVAYDAPAAGVDLAIQYTDKAGTPVVATCEMTGVVNSTAEQVRYIHPFTAASGDSALTPATAAPLVAFMLVGNLAGAGANGLFHIRTFYKVLPDVF